jgi:hypothetical protein
VIREAKFTQGHQPYAVDLESFRPRGPELSSAKISAVWFRRRRAGYTGPLQTVACAGYISECLVDPAPADAADFLARMADGRYGGHCLARWNGTELWAPGAAEDQRADYLSVLGPMLAAYPACPDGWDGWWTFRGC